MEATILDLRYHMKKVLRALDRKEQVKILYHGKVKGIILPAQKRSAKKIEEHPMFGMQSKTKLSVKKQLDTIRSGRYHDI